MKNVILAVALVAAASQASADIYGNSDKVYVPNNDMFGRDRGGVVVDGQGKVYKSYDSPMVNKPKPYQKCNSVFDGC